MILLNQRILTNLSNEKIERRVECFFGMNKPPIVSNGIVASTSIRNHPFK